MNLYLPNEIRKDYLLNRWVIIAAERSKRPSDFVVKRVEKAEIKTCPFCPGNESMTPPAVLLYLPSNGGIQKTKDLNGHRPKGWLVRCVPNLYPALQPLEKAPTSPQNDHHKTMVGTGYHEVIIESPNHDEHPHTARIQQIRFTLDLCIDRLKDILSRDYIRYVSIFRNHGQEAGASLSHAHSQLIATPIVPTQIFEEVEASRNYYEKQGKCVYCKLIEEEMLGPRKIYEEDAFAVFAPWASIYSFEFWIIPKRHQVSLINMTETEKNSLARTIRICFGGLARLLNDPPYSYGFHIAPKGMESNHFHWHLEVYPKLGIHAGFEKSTGMYINVIPPETAAAHLREFVEKEKLVIQNNLR
jgi:UDPglucose--hexose-1-phosphate uridylyltransferase